MPEFLPRSARTVNLANASELIAKTVTRGPRAAAPARPMAGSFIADWIQLDGGGNWRTAAIYGDVPPKKGAASGL